MDCRMGTLPVLLGIEGRTGRVPILQVEKVQT